MNDLIPSERATERMHWQREEDKRASKAAIEALEAMAEL